MEGRSFNDSRKLSGGIFIGSKQRELQNILDLEDHISVWRLYNILEEKLRRSH